MRKIPLTLRAWQRSMSPSQRSGPALVEVERTTIQPEERLIEDALTDVMEAVEADADEVAPRKSKPSKKPGRSK